MRKAFLTVGLITFLSTTSGCRMWTCVGESKQQIARLQIEELDNALGLFHFDTKRCPTTEEGLEALNEERGVQNWSGPYLEKKVIPLDPWGNPFQYESESKDTYRLWSWGADGKKGGVGEDADVTSWE